MTNAVGIGSVLTTAGVVDDGVAGAPDVAGAAEEATVTTGRVVKRGSAVTTGSAVTGAALDVVDSETCVVDGSVLDDTPDGPVVTELVGCALRIVVELPHEAMTNIAATPTSTTLQPREPTEVTVAQSSAMHFWRTV